MGVLYQTLGIIVLRQPPRPKKLRFPISPDEEAHDGATQFHQDQLELCSVIVNPVSGIGSFSGVDSYIWDFTDPQGTEASNLIRQLTLVRNLWHKPIFIFGGSAGGFMAYKVLIDLVSNGNEDLVAGVILGDSLSPFSLSFSPNIVPHALAGIQHHKRYSNGFESVWENRFFWEDYILLGLENSSVGVNTPLLYMHSVNDSIIPDFLKNDFEERLEESFNDLQTGTYGVGHDIGRDGWDRAYDFIELLM